jgi:ketosteroid isomerase-like protein
MPERSAATEAVELVRHTFTARRSDFPDLFVPDVRLDLSERVFNPAVYEGYEGLIRWREEVHEIWESYTSEPEEFFAGENVVVVFTLEIGRGGSSGVEVDRRTALLFRLQSGRVSEMRLYHHRDQAMRDAGLAE